MQQTRTILIPLFRRMVYRPHDTESRLATGVVRRETDCRVCIASLLLLALLLPCCLGIDCSSQRRQVVFSNSTGLALIPAQLCDTDSASSTDAPTTTQHYQHPILARGTQVGITILISCYNAKHVDLTLTFGSAFRVHIAETVSVSKFSPDEATQWDAFANTADSGIADMQISAIHIDIDVSASQKCSVQYQSPSMVLTELAPFPDNDDDGISCPEMQHFSLSGANTIIHAVILSSSQENGKAVWDFSAMPLDAGNCMPCLKNQIKSSASASQDDTCESCYTGIAVHVNRSSEWWHQDLPQPEWAIMDNPTTQNDYAGAGILRYSKRLDTKQTATFFDLTSDSVRYLDDNILYVCEKPAKANVVQISSVALNFHAYNTATPSPSEPSQVGDRYFIFQEIADAFSLINPVAMWCVAVGTTDCTQWSPKNRHPPAGTPLYYVRIE